MTDVIQWTATLTGIVAASLVAAHISLRVTGAAFVVFTVSSVCWIVFAAREDDHGLLVQNIVLTLINLVGVYRYLIAKRSSSEDAR